MNWVARNLDEILELTLVHLALSVPAIVAGFVIAVPIGWAAHRFALARGILLTVCGLLYAIPSLALLIVLPALTGQEVRSPVNLVVALTLYAVAIIVRTAADAFDAVDPGVRQSASALGYGAAGRFWGVELPLAGPVLLSGLRVVIVSTVSLATVGAVIGVQSLGSLFTDGLQRGIAEEIAAGIVMTVVVALVLDGLAVLAGRLLLPWARTGRAARVVPRRASSEGASAV